MKNAKGLDLGIFLISLGVIWILVSKGILGWSILNSLGVLWPLILVVVGVGLIFRNNAIIRGAAWLVFLAVLVVHSFFVTGSTGKDMSAAAKTGDSAVAGTNSIGEIIGTDKKISEEKTAAAEKAQLEIAMGACTINIDSATSKMLEAELGDSDAEYKSKGTDKTPKYYFETGAKVINIFDDKNDSINTNVKNNFHLNGDVPWELNMETGAVNCNFDLTGLEVEKLVLSTGASNVDLKLGAKAADCKVEINSGVSKFNIEVPASAGVKVKMDGAMNSNNLDSSKWDKKGDTYYTKNYDSSTVKIEFDIEMGLGSISFDIK